MNLRNLFRVSAVLSMIFGLVWLVAPEAMPNFYGQDIDPYSAHILQQVGALNISIAVLCFLVSGIAHSPARQAVVTFMLISQVLSGILTLLALLDGDIPLSGGWFVVVFNFAFALAYGYFRFIRPEASLTVGVQS